MSKKILLSLLILFMVLFTVVSVYHYKFEKEMNRLGQLNNVLNIQRDFEVYTAIKENNMSLVEENLELNFMFHLKPIEIDGIEYMLDVKKMKYLCKKYKKIAKIFNEEYDNKYPKSIDGFKEYCN